MIVVGSPSVSVVPAPQNGTDPRKLGESSRKGVRGLSVTQIVMGSLCILFEIILIVLYRADLGFDNQLNATVAPGIWNGVFLLIIGILGVFTAMRNTHGFIIAYMVLNILAAIEMPTFISLTAVATEESTECGGYNFIWISYGGQDCDSYPHLALNVLNLIMAISQFIITIVAASLCCGPACCNSRGHVQTVVYQGAQQQQQQQQFIVGAQPMYGQPGQAPVYGQQQPMNYSSPAPMSNFQVQPTPSYGGQPQPFMHPPAYGQDPQLPPKY